MMTIIEAKEQQARELFAQHDFLGAEKLFRELLQEAPENPTAHYNLGVTLSNLERFEEAIACYRSAIELNPAFSQAYANFGFCLNAFNLILQARQAFSIAKQLTPDDPIPILNEGIAALALGDYAAGWQGFAARWQLPAYGKFKRDFNQPEWIGQDLHGRKLFLYAEQGFGDTLQMARFIPLLAAQGATIIVETPPALTTLICTIETSPLVISKGDPLPEFDYHCALMDLPRVMQVRLESIPSTAPYLSVDPDLADTYRQRLSPEKKKRIGLSWAGRSSHENDHNRSLSLQQIMPLLSLPDIEWVSLQKLIPEQDVEDLAELTALNWGPHFPDFAATAAALSTLDLVITVDTAIAHLAGALGKAVWILLPFYADWRWLLNREDSPWYPSARLFRQNHRGEWPAVIQRLKTELQSTQ